MNFKEFILGFLWLVSIDIGVGFVLYIIWKYIDFKYFSSLEITTLKEENNYLRKENRKVNGSSSEFWNEGDIK